MRLISKSVALAGLAIVAATPAGAQDKPIAIRGGTVVPVSGPAIPNGTVVIRGGKIVAVGANVPVPAGAEIVDARGKYVLPGLVDAMSNIGIAATDQDEPAEPINPANRAFEAYNPFGDFGSGRGGPLRNREILSGGVTTMYVGPADATLIGGQGVVVKTAGPDLAGVVVREPAAMDMTLGTPPKAAARARNRDPATRMAEVAMLRQRLVRAQEYQKTREQNPNGPRDLGLEALGRLLRREFPARIQANHPTDIRSALRLAQEFGFDLVVDGGQGALEFKDELATRRIPVILGQVSHPYVSNEEIPNKEDYPPMDERLPANLTRAGVKTAIATFSRSFGSLAPAGSAKWLLIDAGIASGYGLSEADVLKAVTLIPAEILGVANRVGSLEVGKDADVIVLDGPPLSVKTWVQRVYVGGELVFQK
ncbi:MAG: amidohydrolase family protein [Gemmatimonadales bacterium]|nr:amidohydrolase family protein [Gemmatimonadota bacterium]MCC7133728.1 amidohydrolase family protein [Gemmatimonadales bacterium]MDX2059564.1 amidohydrolase family protein [Gemmatimonadales bacterium]